MFVILYYDVGEKRCSKMLKKCRQYLNWVQNSVFEGDITQAQIVRLMSEINKIINEKENDSVIIYCFESTRYNKRIVMGKDKKNDERFV